MRCAHCGRSAADVRRGGAAVCCSAFGVLSPAAGGAAAHILPNPPPRRRAAAVARLSGAHLNHLAGLARRAGGPHRTCAGCRIVCAGPGACPRCGGALAETRDEALLDLAERAEDAAADLDRHARELDPRPVGRITAIDPRAAAAAAARAREAAR